MSSDLTTLQALALTAACPRPCPTWLCSECLRPKQEKQNSWSNLCLSFPLSLLAYLPSVCTLPHPSLTVVYLPGHTHIFCTHCPSLWGHISSSAPGFEHCLSLPSVTLHTLFSSVVFKMLSLPKVILHGVLVFSLSTPPPPPSSQEVISESVGAVFLFTTPSPVTTILPQEQSRLGSAARDSPSASISSC